VIQRLTPVLALTILAWTGYTESAPPAARGTDYRRIVLSDVLKDPRHFDEEHVRVVGYATLEFEGNRLSVNGPRDEPGQAVWLEVGWPIPPELLPMNGKVVEVEARFDADSNGHMGLFRGALVDIRAIWIPGREADGWVPNHETRMDALEQLDHRTGWIPLGTLREKSWIQTWFDPVKARTGESQFLLPKPGDRIRLSQRMRIHLLDYRTAGEQHRLEDPGARPRSQSDETRLWLPAGALVEVADVRAHYVGSIGVVWARVVPPRER